ncbi:MAG: hypothetical protein GX170_07100 [Campylobacteraceae bacterium]|nr:hypothetical protein [Campylobacteraceae bacterium]
MSPEVQNRINEVKFECAGDVATLKKVNGIETALRWAQRGVFARGARYVFAFFVMIVAILIMAWGGLGKNVINPYLDMLVEKPQYKEAVFLDGLENNKKVYSQNKKAKEK